MPSTSNKKHAQRTKGNLKPSSSSQAAELLTSAGTTGFVGFCQGPKYVPASSVLDDLDTSLDADFRLVLRKLSKRDAITKIKGLQEFRDLCNDKTEDDLKAVLPFWPRIYNKMALDTDYRVREAAQLAMSTLVLRVRRNIAPHLRNLMGAWLLCQCDTYPTVSSAAQVAFQDAFPPVKQNEAVVYCKDSILEYLSENVLVHTVQTLSDPRTTESDDMESKYNRVLTTSLLAVRKLLSTLPANEIKSMKQPFTSFLDNAKFWKHGKSKVNMVKGALYSLLAGLCQTLPELSALYVSKMAPLVLNNLDEADPVICGNVWEATLSLISGIKECWKHVNIQKAFWPKLKKVLETGCLGNAIVIGPSLLPLVSKIPNDLFPDLSKFYVDFFASFRQGLSVDSVLKSPSEGNAVVRSFMECAHYVIIQNISVPIAAHILADQVLPVVEASLIEKNSTLCKSPLYGMIGSLLTAIEMSEEPAANHMATQFWFHLKETITRKLTIDDHLDEFETRVIHFVRCLYNLQTQVTKQVGKVRFEAMSKNDTSLKTMTSDINLPSQVKLHRITSDFVQELVLAAFQEVHVHFQSSHLRLFAQLLEFDSSEQTVAKVIECCHGDVVMETTSHYFVFEICIPWLQKLQEMGGVDADFTHMVHIVCIFLYKLEADSALLLLDNLYESCTDSGSQLILLQKLFAMHKLNPIVHGWLKSAQFGEKLVAHAREVCMRPLDDSWQKDTTSILDMVALVLATTGEDQKPLVQAFYIESLIHVLQGPLQKLASATEVQNRADLAFSFVAKAAGCFFSEYTECLATQSAKDVLLTLFQVSLCNRCHVSNEVITEVRDAWRVGVTEIIRGAGGSLNEISILKLMTNAIQEAVTNIVASLDMINDVMENVTTLLETIQENLPESEQGNQAFTELSKLVIVTVPVEVPNTVWGYLCVKGDHLGNPKTFSEQLFPASTLFTSIYNCKCLSQLASGCHESIPSKPSVEPNITDSYWSDKNLATLLDCVQGSVIIRYFSEQNRQVASIEPLAEAMSDLYNMVYDLIQGLNSNCRDAIWKLAFDRCESELNYVLCLKPLLSQMRSAQSEPVVLDLTPILDRCSVLTESTVHQLHSTLDYVSASSQMVLTEIMVARSLTLNVEAVTEIDGGVGLLSVISHMVALVPTPQPKDSVDMFSGVLDQVMVWKNERVDLFLYNGDLSEAESSCIWLNTEVARFMSAVVKHISSSLTQKQWDFIMCSLASWIQTTENSQAGLTSSPIKQCFVVNVLDLLVQVSMCMHDNMSQNPGSYPDNLAAEWTEFFSESIFAVVVPLYRNVCSNLMEMPRDRSITGTDEVFFTSVCDAAAHVPKAKITDHHLPLLLVAGDLSPLPDHLQSLMNHLAPLLLSFYRAVQFSVYRILYRIMGDLPSYDKEDKAIDIGAAASNNQDEVEKPSRSPPRTIMKVVDEHSSILDVILSDLSLDNGQPITLQEDEYHHTIGYLLSWKLLLKFFKSAPSELRQQYANYFQENNYVTKLMNTIFRLMPSNPGTMFKHKPLMDIRGPCNSTEVQHLTCNLYLQVLKTMPAIVRNWWKEQDRKTTAFVDTFTTKYVSQLLCAEEIQSVQTTDVQLDNMTVKVRPATREVIAVYSMEEVSIEVVIALPSNYPLGNIQVISDKRVGVSGSQWEKWLLQLGIFLQHQNGNVMDGLKLWKRNIDQRFEGVGECMICFYVLHGTNFQLPKITCRTCKKKYHPVCLYKWFKTSHNCTCPLCRNVF